MNYLLTFWVGIWLFSCQNTHPQLISTKVVDETDFLLTGIHDNFIFLSDTQVIILAENTRLGIFNPQTGKLSKIIDYSHFNNDSIRQFFKKRYPQRNYISLDAPELKNVNKYQGKMQPAKIDKVIYNPKENFIDINYNLFTPSLDTQDKEQPGFDMGYSTSVLKTNTAFQLIDFIPERHIKQSIKDSLEIKYHSGFYFYKNKLYAMLNVYSNDQLEALPLSDPTLKISLEKRREMQKKMMEKFSKPEVPYKPNDSIINTFYPLLARFRIEGDSIILEKKLNIPLAKELLKTYAPYTFSFRYYFREFNDSLYVSNGKRIYNVETGTEYLPGLLADYENNGLYNYNWHPNKKLFFYEMQNSTLSWKEKQDTIVVYDLVKKAPKNVIALGTNATVAALDFYENKLLVLLKKEDDYYFQIYGLD